MKALRISYFGGQTESIKFLFERLLGLRKWGCIRLLLLMSDRILLVGLPSS